MTTETDISLFSLHPYLDANGQLTDQLCALFLIGSKCRNCRILSRDVDLSLKQLLAAPNLKSIAGSKCKYC